jgi:hypothetical protein
MRDVKKNNRQRETSGRREYGTLPRRISFHLSATGELCRKSRRWKRNDRGSSHIPAAPDDRSTEGGEVRRIERHDLAGSVPIVAREDIVQRGDGGGRAKFLGVGSDPEDLDCGIEKTVRVSS